MIEINFGDHRKGVVDRFPNECPYCHKIISPILITHNKSSKGVELIFSCSNQQCQKAFIGFYASEQLNNFNLFDVSIGEVKDVVFSENIICISPSFSKIYNQANFAEQNKLYEICGVGYRKALEFLIKDFLIMKNPENEKSIKIKALGKCISEDIEDVRIKMVAKRAVWLGNDETHYVKKWLNKDLNDLKSLIQLTVHWIEMVFYSDELEKNMPE